MTFLKALIIVACLALALANGDLLMGPQEVVSGAVGCGGSSLFVNMALTNCTTAPCTVKTSTTYEISITFYSGDQSSNIQWLCYMYYPNGGVTQLADKIADGSIDVGSGYTVADFIQVPDRWQGIDGELSVMLLNTDNGGSRITCGYFPIVVV